MIVQGGRAIGACALEATHGGQMLWIMVLVTVPGAWHVALRSILRHATEHTPALTVDIKLFALDGRRRRMWCSGFTEREEAVPVHDPQGETADSSTPTAGTTTAATRISTRSTSEPTPFER